VWKNEVQIQSTHSELYFVLCFISIPYVDAEIQTWKYYFLNTVHILGIAAGASALSQP
jgi:hypothetical protein